MEKYRKASNMVRSGAALVLALFLLHYTGIGCPIKFLTGVSCPGCGMTRAWLSALHLRFDLALAYHPLFWLVPLLLALVLVRKRLGRRLYTAILVVCLAAVIIVWILRLATPREANVLFSGLLQEDVVSVGPPRWAQILRLWPTP